MDNLDKTEGFIYGVLAAFAIWALLSLASYKPTKLEGWYVLNAFMICQSEMQVDYMVKNDKGWKVRCNSGEVQELKE